MTEKLLTVDEISKILGVAKSTLYSWTHQKKIPHIKVGKRTLRFRENDLLQWIAEKAVHVQTVESSQTAKKRRLQPKYSKADDDVQRLVNNAKNSILKK